MALINCAECGKQVSDKAAACPHCGAPVVMDAPPAASDGAAYGATFPDMAEHGAALKKYAAEQKKTKKNFWIGMAFLGVIIVGSCSIGGNNKKSAASPPQKTSAVAAAQAEEMARATKACIDEAEAKLAEHAALLAADKDAEARGVVGRCALLTKDARYVTASLLANHHKNMQVVQDARATELDRVTAFDSIPREFADFKEKHEKSISRIRKKAEAQRERIAIARAKDAEVQAELARSEEASKRWKNTVRVGQTEGDVLAYGWGRPDKVNRTTNAYGVREQWVYDNKYLYFENGILTSIQD